MRYRIKLINSKTGERMITTWAFSSKKKAVEWATKWKESMEEADCEILDTKNGFKKVEF